jgi:hypothetical protein
MNAPDYLVETIPHVVHPIGPTAPNPWLAPILPLLLSVAAGVLCYRAAGLTLGLFLGGLIAVVLLAGPLLAAEDTWLGRALVAAGVIHGIASVWLYAAIKLDMDIGLWAACYLALCAMVVAAGGLTAMLRRIGVGHIGAGAIVTVLGLAWMLWPVWLSPALHGPRGERIVAWLVPAHPLFAVNGVLLRTLGYWTDQAGIAYHYTSLSDDLAYAVPESVLMCVLLHGCVGTLGGMLALIKRKENELAVDRRG